jgi:hypothetical protein
VHSLFSPYVLFQLRVGGVPFLFFLSLPVLQSGSRTSLALVYINLIYLLDAHWLMGVADEANAGTRPFCARISCRFLP